MDTTDLITHTHTNTHSHITLLYEMNINITDLIRGLQMAAASDGLKATTGKD